MGLIAKVLSVLRTTRNGAKITDVKSDPGGGDNVTPQHFSAPGDDSHPLETDYVFMERTLGSGKYAALGYVDPLNAQVSGVGEKRIYARDSSGAPVAYVWLRNGGSLELNGAADFAVAYNDLLAAFNELKSEINAAITIFNAHVHPDPVSGSTGAPTTTQTDAAADMTGAKVETVRLP